MRLVFIEWVDSARGDVWESLDEENTSDLRCHSVGWLLLETDDRKVLVPHISADKKQGCGSMTIPKRAIISMRDLCLGPSKAQ